MSTLRLSAEEYEGIRRRIASRLHSEQTAEPEPPAPKPRMNKTETEYGLLLRARQTNGEILWYDFEPLTFRLAPKTRYTPDFIIQRQDGSLEAHEVKGFWRDDARVKIKVAARLFPWLKFIAVKKGKQGAWYREEIRGE